MPKLDMGICLSTYDRSGILRRYSPFLQYVRTYVVLLLYADGGGMLGWGERRGEESGPRHGPDFEV